MQEEEAMGWLAAMVWECNRLQNKLRPRRKHKRKNVRDVRSNRNWTMSFTTTLHNMQSINKSKTESVLKNNVKR